MKKVFIFATLMTMMSPVYAKDTYDFTGIKKICSDQLPSMQYMIGDGVSLTCDQYGSVYQANQIKIPVYNQKNSKIGEAVFYVFKIFDSEFSYRDDGKISFVIVVNGDDFGLIRNVDFEQNKVDIISSETKIKDKRLASAATGATQT